jgi:hypothetical protein
VSDENVTIQASEALRDGIQRIGRWYLAHGVNVTDEMTGGVDYAATVAQMVQDMLGQIEDTDVVDEDDEVILARFRRSLGDALAGKTFPIEHLWEGIVDE